MVTRPAHPPDLAGYTYVDLIGQGGFADVFLYEQRRPSRHVAVKVLLEQDAQAEDRQRFDAEADVMAQLSSHPSIVSIFQADVADDGRAFLVMEFCPKPNLAVRCRQQPLSVPEALEIGIRISGAVETAHRAGILHRDIKPHNVLVDAYDQPKLTDFGIAVATGSAATVGGMSVPWSPPEMFTDQPPNDPRSDVYSLGATVYTLLAGRSPYEIVGGNNDNHALMTRIERSRPARPGRADVGDRLWETLDRSLASAPADRHPAAIAFARALQDAQIALHLTPTRIDVLDGSADDPISSNDDDSRTSIRPIAVIPQSTTISGAPIGARRHGTAREAYDAAGGAPRAGAQVPRQPLAEDTLARPAAAAPTPHDPTAARPTQPTDGPTGSTFQGVSVDASAAVGGEQQASGGVRRPARPGLVVGLLGLAVIVAVAIFATVGREAPEREGTQVLDDGDRAVAVTAAPPPPEMARPVVRGDQAVFAWKNPDPQPGDLFRWREDGGQGAPTVVEESRIRVPLGPDGSVCVLVQVVRDARFSEDVRSCAPAGS